MDNKIVDIKEAAVDAVRQLKRIADGLAALAQKTVGQTSDGGNQRQIDEWHQQNKLRGGVLCPACDGSGETTDENGDCVCSSDSSCDRCDGTGVLAKAEIRSHDRETIAANDAKNAILARSDGDICDIPEMIGRLSVLIHQKYAVIVRAKGKRVAENWFADVQGNLNTYCGMKVDGAGEAVKVLAVKRGMMRGAHFARTYRDTCSVEGVPQTHTRAVLSAFAVAMEKLTDSYGTHCEEDDLSG